MLVAITCEKCGMRNELDREVHQPSIFHVICVKCEATLKVIVTDADLMQAQMRANMLNWNNL